MTNDEAVRVLREFRSELAYGYDKERTALTRAIEALEREGEGAVTGWAVANDDGSINLSSITRTETTQYGKSFRVTIRPAHGDGE